MTENKKQSSYAILKAKLVEKDQEIESLKSIISTERNKSDLLTLDLFKERQTVKELHDLYTEAVNHMGWLHRLIYGYQKNK